MASKKPARPGPVPAPAPDVEMWVPIYRAKKDETIQLVAVNDWVEGFWVHYWQGKTVPCIGKHSQCLCATTLVAKRWCAYLGAWDPQPCRRVLAEITLDCYRASPHIFNHSKHLRGLQFGLFRLGARDNAPVRIVLGGQVPEGVFDNLPDPIRVQEVLWRIWGVADQGEDT